MDSSVDGTYLLVYLYDENGAPIGMRYRTPSMAKNVFQNYFFEKNLQGDVIGIWNQGGTKIVTYTYDAWGNVTVSGTSASTIGKWNPFRYRGYYYDVENGLYYLQSRYYNPAWGRFINVDGLLCGGLIGCNLFAYCGNNPILFVDRYGALFGVDDAIALGSALLALSVISFSTISLMQNNTYSIDGVYNELSSLFSNYAFISPSLIADSLAWEIELDNMIPSIVNTPLSPIVYDNSMDRITVFERRAGPVGKPGRKKQGREVNNKNRKKDSFKSRSNKDPNRPMKKHTPNSDHQKIMIPFIRFDNDNNQYIIKWE